MMAAANSYYQGITISPAWDKVSQFVLHIHGTLSHAASLLQTEAPSPVQKFILQGKRESHAMQTTHSSRHWKRWRGLVPHPLVLVQKTRWEIQLWGCWHLYASLHAEEVKKLLHLSNAGPPTLICCCWFVLV